METNRKNNIKSKLKRIRMELDILNSDLNELEDTGFTSDHVMTALHYVHLAINELSIKNIKDDLK